MNNRIRILIGEKTFNILNVIFMITLSFIMFYPIWHVVCASFSNANRILQHKGLLLLPDGFSVNAYLQVFKNPMIIRSYLNTIFIVVVGVIINIIMTSFAAYFLSRKNVFFSGFIMVMIVFTMKFSGGIIPFYFAVKGLGLENSLWAVILPGAINTFNLIIMRTSFMSIPDSLEESAKLDGAGHLRILFSIILPLSKSIIAVMVLYYAVGHWSAWFNAMLFINDRQKFPLQLILREIIIQNDTTSMTQGIDTAERAFISETIKYAVIVVATIPILCIYPFVQKYFVKGVMIGAVKG